MSEGAVAAPRVVAIDGPAGVGKSTVARRLAQRLGLPYLDTGAMYRALALEAVRRGVDAEDPDEVEELVASTEIGLRLGSDRVAQVVLGASPVGDEIRTPEVGEATSCLAVHASVRRHLVELQRDFGRRYGAVLEGRDIGSVVFPDTPYKFFLEARPEVRAQRRRDQLRDAGQAVSENGVVAELLRRDRRDRDRSESPLRSDDSYVHIDTSDRSVDEVVAEMEARVLQGEARSV